MTRAAQSTRPIETLSDAIRSLEAAALVCLASPKKKPVHQLRTWTRRVEAQLELIALLPASPLARKQREKAFRILKKLRHAAGVVRDLDVERDLIAAEAARTKGPSRAALAIRREARTLRHDLKLQRDDEANALVSLLRKEQKKLPLTFNDLSDALKRAKDGALTEDKLIALSRGWFAGGNPRQLREDDETEVLHSIRKRAKHARYMAEGSPPAFDRAHRLAERFEALQQAGGTWHDWLQLRDVATKELGKSAQLPQRFRVHADRSLRTFKRRLQAAHVLIA